MEASSQNVKEGDTIIFRCDEYRDGRPTEFDGTVQSVEDGGVNALYLSGYRSRDDFIPWGDILAKVDMSKPKILLKCGAFRGHFLEFTESDKD